MEQETNEPLFELQVDYDSGNAFTEITKWTKFISIVYFVALAIGIAVMAFASTVLITAFGSIMPQFAAAGGILVAVIIIVIGIYLVIAIFLFRFSTLVKEGIARQDQQTFAEGIKSLKNYFLVTGVVAILTLVFRVIGIISTAIGASF